ncbi:hypothetical protein [Paenibacillus agaridevorans]|uniref:hypothetical protein n=1 Tax=Paenibacillus agaridevorans TaxID=171404 RepID=UPI001BE433DB|nr:hypothetical protein [Paenibacillus agaridevorans]
MSKKRREKMKAKASRHSVSKPAGQSTHVNSPKSEALSIVKPKNVERAKSPVVLKEAAPGWGNFYSSIQAAVREIG